MQLLASCGNALTRYHPRIALRRIILRILLWSLAFAAVTGVLCALVASRSITGRMVWTGVITAVACVLTLPFSILLEKPPLRLGSLIGLGTVVACFMAGLIGIWISVLPGPIARYDGEFGLTSLVLAVTGVPATVAALGRAHDAMRRPCAVLLFAQPILLIMYLSATWMLVISPGASELMNRLWGTATPGTIALVLLTIGRLGPRPLAVIAWIAAPVGWLMAIGEFWDIIDIDGDWHVGPWSIAVLTAYLAILTIPRLGDVGTVIRWATAGAAVALTAMCNVLALTSAGDFSERLTIALTILVATGSVAVVIFAALSRRQIVVVPQDDIFMAATCPRCKTDLRLMPGENHCAACGLQIKLDLEAPRCRSCGYLLHQTTSPNCPECGTPCRSRAPSALA